MKIFHASLVLSLAVSFIACSGGGRSRVAGRQCKANYTPVDMNVDGNLKKSLATGLPEGKYKYVKGGLYYIDQNDFRVMINDFPPAAEAKGEVTTSSVYCVRNAVNMPEDLQTIESSIVGVDVKVGGVLSADVKDFGFKITPKEGLKAVSVNLSGGREKTEKPEDIYSADGEAFVIELSEEVYQIRSRVERSTATIYRFAEFVKEKDAE